MKHQVWSEGYVTSGERADATYHGDWEGETFAEACATWASTASRPSLFNSERLTYWGCRLFDNEADARKAFG